jgi:hypothetical protein
VWYRGRVQTPGQQYYYCSYCGYERPIDAKFCLHCGRAVVEEPATKKRDDSISDELFKSSPYYANTLVVLDFEKNKANAAIRAERWAEYEASSMRVKDWIDLLRVRGLLMYANYNWGLESSWFPTNKPNAHEALFIKASMAWFIREARARGYIDYFNTFGQQVYAFCKHQYGWTDEELADLRFDESFITEYPELDELAKKDDELFPPPKPLREEVAGAILNFMTDEGVLVVYMDCSLSGKRVEIDIDDIWISSAYGYDHRKAEILERSDSGTPICAAIFTRIPFVTDTHRNRQEVLKQLQVTVKFSSFENQQWEEKVTLFPGKVAELDWRGRTPQPKVQPETQQQPQPAVTPSNTATLQGAKITFKNIDRKPDEDLYIIELTDPGHLDEPQLVYVHVGDGEPQQQAAASGLAYAASSYSEPLTPLPSQPSYGSTGTGKVQHIYLKRKK